MNQPPSPPGPPFVERADIETASEGYAQRFAGSVGQYFLDTQARACLDLLAPWPGARVLEVGGGHAQVAPALAAAGYGLTITGSDDSCRDRLDRLMPPGSFEYLTCDMLALPFPAKSFDLVLALRLLPHVERWPDLVAEMGRVASRAIVVDYPDLRGFNYFSQRLFKAKQAIEKNTRPFRCFRRRELIQAFASHGFGRPALRPQFFLPMALHRAMNSAGLSRGAEALSGLLRLKQLLGSPVIMRVEAL